MRIVINILLFLVVVALGYLLYQSLSEPILFESEWAKRENAVKNKLMQIRDAQIAYKSIKGEYAPTFDDLTKVLTEEKFEIKSVIGDPDDPNSNYQTITTYVNAVDSMQSLGINLDSLMYVPFSDSSFVMNALVLEEYQNAKNIPVMECKVRIRDYMGPYADPKFSRYNKQYKPETYTKFGDLTTPSTDGNWRK